MRRGAEWSTAGLLVLVLVMAGCSDDDVAGPAATPTRPPTPAETDSPSPTPADTTDEEQADVEADVTVESGQVAGGVERIPVEVGETVALRVSSDVADTVHVHGYDLHASVAPDEPAVVRFAADIPGVFEAELEERGLLIAEFEITG